MIAKWSLALTAVSAFALASCATSAPTPPPVSEFSDEPLEAILAWRVDGSNELVVRFESNGCTTRDSFEVFVFDATAETGAFEVGFVRRYADRCRALLPQGVPLIWTKADLGLEPRAEIEVLNPIDNGRPPLPSAPPEGKS